MVSWFGRRPVRMELPLLRPRADAQVKVDRVNLAELTPDLLPYLGQVAYLHLVVFQSLSSAVADSPNLADKEGLSTAAGHALAVHQGFVAEIRRRNDDPAEVMQPFSSIIDRFDGLIRGRDPDERLLSSYITLGLLDDFYLRLTDALPGDFGARAARLLRTDSGAEVIVAILQRSIAADPALASRLAMWGRRLVGDTLLMARSALHASGNSASDESRIEPVFTELIAAHTRRMDGLGLNA